MPDLKQELALRQLQKISPQQIQTIKLLEYPAMQLGARIKRELEENPLLEEREEEDDNTPIETFLRESEETPAYRFNLPSYTKDMPSRELFLSSGRSLRDSLEEQLAYKSLSEEQMEIARYLIGNIDQDGYMRRELGSIADDLAFNLGIDATIGQIEQVLHVIQSMEPVGVGCRDLHECLLLQLRAIPSPTEAQQLACRIVAKSFDDFSNHRYERIMERMGITADEFRAAREEITRLSPKPGNLFTDDGNDAAPYVTPDFLLDYRDGEFVLSLNGHNIPDVHLSRRYLDMIRRMKDQGDRSEERQETLKFLRTKLESANWFITALRQRQQTMLAVMNKILERQREYFIDGDLSKLHPMILKEIADKVHMDMSTISRVVNSKYIQTHFGTFALRDFFSGGITGDDGQEISSHEIRQTISELIAAENKSAPITDQQLMDELAGRGIPLARRTVAKYREALGIPIARLRKEL